jgi:hypothetical protein
MKQWWDGPRLAVVIVLVKVRDLISVSGWELQPELDLAFPWADLPADATICDIGGGKGHVMRQILREHPHLRAVIQDLDPVIEDAKLASLNLYQ